MGLFSGAAKKFKKAVKKVKKVAKKVGKTVSTVVDKVDDAADYINNNKVLSTVVDVGGSVFGVSDLSDKMADATQQVRDIKDYVSAGVSAVKGQVSNVSKTVRSVINSTNIIAASLSDIRDAASIVKQDAEPKYAALIKELL